MTHTNTVPDNSSRPLPASQCWISTGSPTKPRVATARTCLNVLQQVICCIAGLSFTGRGSRWTWRQTRTVRSGLIHVAVVCWPLHSGSMFNYTHLGCCCCLFPSWHFTEVERWRDRGRERLTEWTRPVSPIATRCSNIWLVSGYTFLFWKT